MFADFYQEYLGQFQEALSALDVGVIEEIAQVIAQAREERRQVFLVGNGGSAAAASHWACDLGKGLNNGRRERLRVLSLTDNVSWLTAVGNDLDYADVFVEQLRNYLNAGDVVIGLSVSGNSPSVVRAFAYAKEMEAVVVSITGGTPNTMESYASVSLRVPSKNYGIVEDAFMFLDHAIMQYLRDA